LDAETQATPQGAGSSIPFPTVQSLAGPVSFFLGVMAIAFMFAMDFLTNDLSSLPFVRDRLPIAQSELGRNHDRLVVITLILLVSGALAAITFLTWLYRTYADVRALRPHALRQGPWSAVVPWLVPVINLVLPFVPMRAMWRASDPDFDPEDPRPPRVTVWFWLWWLSWIVTSVLFFLAFAPVVSGSPTAAQLITRDHLAIAACATGIAAAILTISTVQVERGRLILLEDRLRNPDWRGWTKRR
jgi:hypothetical protein